MRHPAIKTTLAISIVLLLAYAVISSLFPPHVHDRQELRFACLWDIQRAAAKYYTQNGKIPASADEALAILPEEERSRIHQFWQTSTGGPRDIGLDQVRIVAQTNGDYSSPSAFSVEVDLGYEVDILAFDGSEVVRKKH
jgi:hypothetical protein